MPDKLLKDGLRTSAKIGAVAEFAELLFVRLILATCHAGRCPWDPDWIRTHALPNRPRKRLTEIAAALDTLRRAHLVTRYTGHDGTAYLLIPNHGQRLSYRVRSPWPAPPEGPPDADGQTFMDIPGAPPPSSVKKPKSRVSESATHFTSLLTSSSDTGDRPPTTGHPIPSPCSSDLRLAADCLAELSARYPRHDVRACLRDARRYVRKERGEEADVTVGWFVVHWMTKAAEKPGDGRPRPDAAASAARTAEQARWRAEQQEKLATLAAGPEPAQGTLDHAIWLEARKTA